MDWVVRFLLGLSPRDDKDRVEFQRVVGIEDRRNIKKLLIERYGIAAPPFFILGEEVLEDWFRPINQSSQEKLSLGKLKFCDLKKCPNSSFFEDSDSDQITNLLAGYGSFAMSSSEEFFNKIVEKLKGYCDFLLIKEVHFVDPYLFQRTLFDGERKWEKGKVNDQRVKNLKDFNSNFQNAKGFFYGSLNISDNHGTFDITDVRQQALKQSLDVECFQFNDVHDRFIILESQDTVAGIVIGASLNSYEGSKKVFLVSKIEDDDIRSLLGILKEVRAREVNVGSQS